MATVVRGGGVAVIHKDCWKSRRVNFQLELRSFEFVCTRIDVKPTSIILDLMVPNSPSLPGWCCAGILDGTVPSCWLSRRSTMSWVGFSW